MKPEVKANEKPSISNEHESDDDSYSQENIEFWKTLTEDNLDRKTTHSADLPRLNNEIKFVDENDTKKQQANTIIVRTSNIKHHRNAQEQKHGLI